eukprot:70997_1
MLRWCALLSVWMSTLQIGANAQFDNMVSACQYCLVTRDSLSDDFPSWCGPAKHVSDTGQQRNNSAVYHDSTTTALSIAELWLRHPTGHYGNVYGRTVYLVNGSEGNSQFVDAILWGSLVHPEMDKFQEFLRDHDDGPRLNLNDCVTEDLRLLAMESLMVYDTIVRDIGESHLKSAVVPAWIRQESSAEQSLFIPNDLYGVINTYSSLNDGLNWEEIYRNLTNTE